MAKSAAKRKREHLLRNRGKDVSLARNEVNFSTHVRMTKSKKAKLQQQYTKYEKHFTKGIIPDGNAFYYALFFKFRKIPPLFYAFYKGIDG